MAKISRPKSRRYLFQALYARSVATEEIDPERFQASFFDAEYVECLDLPYVEDVYNGVIANQSLLLNILERYASRFGLKTMARANLVIACMALYEMFFIKVDTIPEKVVMNEALELAKTYSDPATRTFINGVLNSAKNDREIIIAGVDLIKHPYTFLFPSHVGEEPSSES